MQKYDVHFCLVSAQAAPNLFPISDSRFKPNQIVLFVSSDMQKQAEQLERIFKLSKIETKSYAISKPFDFENCEEEIHSALLDYVGDNDIADLSMALNLTGGTKPMSLAAYSVFSAYGKGEDAFYVDTSNHRFSFLTKKEHSFTMQLALKVRNYLLAYGYEVLKSEKNFDPNINRMFEDYFVNGFHQNKHTIGTLNAYAYYADKKDIYHFSDKDDVITGLYNFLYDLKEIGFIQFNDKELDFKNNKQFMSGGWLEHFAFQEVKKLNGIDDVEMNIEYSNLAFDKSKKDFVENNQGRKNELDVAFLAKNKLHIIECKTKKMGKDGEEDETQDIIHKLKSLRDNVGVMTKGCLISYVPVSTAVRNRANDEGIKIIEGSQIQALGKHLQEWIDEE